MPGLVGISVLLALAAEPSVGSPEPHGDPRLSPAPGDQRFSHAATAGDLSVVTWTDERVRSAEVWGTRLKPGGQLPDRYGRRILTGSEAWASEIATAPGVIFITWQEGASRPYSNYGALFTEDGESLSGAILLGPPGSLTEPSVAWTGTDFIAAWVDLDKPELVASRVARDGMVTTAALTTTSDVHLASVACSPRACLVAFESQAPVSQVDDVLGRFFDPATLAFISPELTIAGGANSEILPVAAYNPATDSFVVAWEEAAASNDVVLAAVSLDGGVLTSAPLEQTAENEEHPAVSCRPDAVDRCAVAFRTTSSREVHLWRIRGDLTLVDASPQIWPGPTGDVSDPVVSLSPDAGVVAWHGSSPGILNGQDVYGVPLDGAGLATQSPILLSAAANGQEFPSVAASGDRHWLFWRDDARGGVPGNYQASVADPSGWRVEDVDASPNAESFDRGVIAASGNQALALWGDDGSTVKVGYAVIDGSGNVTRTGLVPGAVGGCRGPAAAPFAGTIWATVTCGIPSLLVTSFDGASFASKLQIGSTGSSLKDPAMATDGRELRVVWADDRPGTHALFGLRLDSDGGTRDGQGVRLLDSGGEQTRPSLAWSEDAWLLAWEDDGPNGTRVLGARFGADWRPLDGQPLVLRENPELRDVNGGVHAPQLLAIPGGFLLAWEEDTNRGDVRASLIDLKGTVEAPFDISATPEWEGQVALAPGRSETEVLAAHAGFDPGETISSRRVFTRWIDLTGQAGVDGGDGQDGGGDGGGSPGPAATLAIGCDCSSAGGGALGVALLAALAAARVRPRGRSGRRS